MAGVVGPETFGDQQLDGLVSQFGLGVAEKLFCLGIDQENAALLVYDDHRIRADSSTLRNCSPASLRSVISFWRSWLAASSWVVRS